MLQQELLKQVIEALRKTKIQYMITGSVVSSLQGEPRLTHDIDLVVGLQKTQVKKLADVFWADDFFLDEKSIVKAIDTKRMFNIICEADGNKIDFWMLTDDPFDKSRFSRRITEDFMGLKMIVSTPEDTILAKLKWAKESGGSEKQFIDALRVYEVQYGAIDIDYIVKWVKKLRIESLWKRMTNEAELI